MRIVSGIRRGMNLLSLKGEHTRPTSDKVKEAIFSMIQFYVKDAICLDLFAGSGAMGIEAISRGAAFVYFSDHYAPAIEIVKKNLEKAKFTEFANVRLCSADAAISRLPHNSIDLVFLDPPYGKQLVQKSMMKCLDAGILKKSAIIVCEQHVDDALPRHYGEWELIKSKRYSETVIGIYQAQSAAT